MYVQRLKKLKEEGWFVSLSVSVSCPFICACSFSLFALLPTCAYMSVCMYVSLPVCQSMSVRKNLVSGDPTLLSGRGSVGRR